MLPDARLQMSPLEDLVTPVEPTNPGIEMVNWGAEEATDRRLEAPRPVVLAALKEAGIPTVDTDAFEQALDDLTDRRRILLGLTRSDAREWPG
jgi:hypothetical protein